jgi:hypothetical protein
MKTVRFRSAKLQEGFTMVPNGILTDSSLSMPARLTWALLAQYAWEDESAFPGQARLAEELGVTDRSLRDYLRELEAAGLLETVQRGMGRTNEYVIAAARTDRNSASGQNGTQLPVLSEEDSLEEDTGSPLKPPRRRKTKVLAPDEEPIGFSEWLGYHCEKAERSVPRAGTSYRSELARAFSEIMGEGYELEDFKLASDGVLADELMLAGGHTKPENVLRKSKIGGRVDDGRRARSRPMSEAERVAAKYAHLDA